MTELESLIGVQYLLQINLPWRVGAHVWRIAVRLNESDRYAPSGSIAVVKFPTKLDELIPPAAMSRVLELLSQPALTNTVKEAMQKVGLKDAAPVTQIQEAWRQARTWVESVVHRVLEQAEASPVVINATGCLFDARWHSLPTDSVVVQSMAAAAVSFQDETLLEQYAERNAVSATGAPSAAFGCNTSAICVALLGSAAKNGKLVVGRTDVVRIPGSTDIRNLLSRASDRVVEVGAVNGVSTDEWQRAFTSQHDVLLLVSPNNLDGSSANEQRLAAISAARAKSCSVVEILFDATLHQGLSSQLRFPNIRERIEAGIDLVIAPLDLLLGGPSGAIAVGKHQLVAALKDELSVLGLKLYGAALAGAAVALQSNEEAGTPTSAITQLLLTRIDNLKDRARRIAIQLNGTKLASAAEGVAVESKLGPSPWNRYSVPSYAVSISPRDQSCEALRAKLATGQLGPAIWARVDGDKLLLDLRLVDPADDHLLVTAFVGEELNQSVHAETKSADAESSGAEPTGS